MPVPFLLEHVYEHHYPLVSLTPDWPQAYRYMGIPGGKVPEETIQTMAKTCLTEQIQVASGHACYQYFPLFAPGNNTLNLGFTQVTSSHLTRHLQGCEGILLFAATIGSGVDRLITRDGLKHPAYPTIHHGVGSMLVEIYCDYLEQHLKQMLATPGFDTVTRFSPGYGDLPLALQTDIFQTLQPHRIGMTLTDTLLMRPSKSVTAIIGIKSPT